MMECRRINCNNNTDLLLRPARGPTQKQLAESMNLQEQQIQRYEATSYEGAALERIEAIAKVLGIRETVKFELSMPLRVTKARA